MENKNDMVLSSYQEFPKRTKEQEKYYKLLVSFIGEYSADEWEEDMLDVKWGITFLEYYYPSKEILLKARDGFNKYIDLLNDDRHSSFLKEMLDRQEKHSRH